MAGKAGLRLSCEPLIGMLAANNIDPEFIEGPLNGNIRQAKNRGYFTLAMADEIAVKVLKMHPVEVWGAEYEETVWFDMDDTDEPQVEAKVIGFPAPVPNPEPVYLAVAA